MVFGIGIVMTSVLTLFTPLAAETSIWLLVALRIMEGFSEVVAKLVLLLKSCFINPFYIYKQVFIIKLNYIVQCIILSGVM